MRTKEQKDKYNEARRLRYHNDIEYRRKKQLADKNRKRNKKDLSPEKWKERLEYVKKYRKTAPLSVIQKIKKYNLEYREKNKEYFSKHSKKRSLSITDSYVANIISNHFDIPVEEVYNNNELITLKRKIIELKRIIKCKEN